jgi:DNA-binding response OmpR family regulator
MPTIVIVDNDRAFIDTLRRLLVDAGYQVITATDGHAALAAFHARRPDVVVLEWQIPGLDGLTLIRRIRELAATPILMLTTRAAIGDRVTALDNGADDYLVKPSAPAKLLARLRVLIRRAQGPATSCGTGNAGNP